MSEEQFVNLYYQEPPETPDDSKIPAGLNEAKEKTSDPKVGNVPVTHPVDGGKKHPKIGCAWDAMGPHAGSGENGPFDGLADGEGAQIGEGAGAPAPAGDAGGGSFAGGESVSPKQMNAILEAIEAKYPGSSAVPQIRDMFNSIQCGGNGKLYCSADGCESVSDPMMSDADEAISAAAAAVEAALMTYRKVAGHDYPGMYNKYTVVGPRTRKEDILNIESLGK